MARLRGRWLLECVWVVALLRCVSGGELAQPETAPNAIDIVKQMRVFCSGLNSVACEIDYKRVLKSARLDSERSVHFDAAFQRPNLLSILMKDEDRVTYAWISDGTDVSTYMAGAEKYMKHKAPETLDALLSGEEMYVVNPSIEDALLIHELLQKSAVNALPAGATGASYIGAETINGEPAHHIRLKRQPADWDVWISAGPAPLPLRVFCGVSTIEPVPPGAKSQFTVDFTRWLPDAALDPRAFKFDPSSKAKRVSGFLPEEAPHPLLNHAAPAATLEGIDGGRTTLAAHQGRDIVVLDFWSMTCVPCIGLLPKVDTVAQRFKGRGVVFYAMNENDAAEDIRAFFKTRGISLNATLHNKNANFPAFKVDAIPRLFVIDKAGVIRIVHSVQSKDLISELSAQLERLLAK